MINTIPSISVPNDGCPVASSVSYFKVVKVQKMRIAYWVLCSYLLVSSSLILLWSTIFERALLKLGTSASGKLLGLPLLISMVFLVQMVLNSGWSPSMIKTGIFGSLMKQSSLNGNPSMLMSKKYSRCFCS